MLNTGVSTGKGDVHKQQVPYDLSVKNKICTYETCEFISVILHV